MLVSLAVNNFRSLHNVQVNLEQDMIAFVGRNGVGKTNLLHAIKQIARICTGAVAPNELDPTYANRSASMALRFKLDGIEYEYSIAKHVPTERSKVGISESLINTDSQELLFDRTGERVRSRWHPEQVTVSQAASALPSVRSLMSTDSESFNLLGRISAFMSSVHYYRATDTIREHETAWQFIPFSAYNAWKAGTSKHHDSVALRLIDLEAQRDINRKWDELMELLGPDGLNIVENIVVNNVPGPIPQHSGTSSGSVDEIGGYLLAFVPCKGLAGAGSAFPYSGLSTGTRRAIQIVTYLVCDSASVMLLEQPEDSMHFGLLQCLIDTLRSYSDKSQVIFTTHSARVINLLDPEAVRLVEATDGSTAVRQLSPSEIELATNYRRAQGTLSQYLDTL